MNNPQVLLLDEPLGALDLKLRKQMQVELKRIQSEIGITFIFVTHDQEEAMTMSDRIAVMRHGRIEQLGTPEELYERPATEFVAGFLGVSNLLDAEVAGRGDRFADVRLADGTHAAGADLGAERRDQASASASGPRSCASSPSATIPRPGSTASRTPSRARCSTRRTSASAPSTSSRRRTGTS